MCHSLLSPGNGVLLTKPPGIIPKILQPGTGPLNVMQVFTNDTAQICHGNIIKMTNIGHLTPFLC
jgi:hypothetical protein